MIEAAEGLLEDGSLAFQRVLSAFFVDPLACWSVSSRWVVIRLKWHSVRNVSVP